MPLISDGVYQIYNSQFSDCVGLDSRDPLGAICANKANNQWLIKNESQGETSNEVTIRNINMFIGTYTYADQVQAASVHGSSTSMIWTLVDRGSGKFSIQSPDGVYVWQLPSSGGCVILTAQTGNEDTEWTFSQLDSTHESATV